MIQPQPLTRIDFALRGSAALAALFNWVIHPLRGGLNGDFLAMLSHRDHPGGYWDGEGYGYGPIFAIYDLVLRRFHDVEAMHLMFAVNLLLTAVMLVGLWFAFPQLRSSTRALSWTMLCVGVFYPYAQLVRQNNIEITEVCLLVWFIQALRRGGEVRAGMFLGLAAATKLLPLALLAPIIWRKRFSLAATAVTTFVSALVIVGMIKGFAPWDGFAIARNAASSGWAQSHASSQSMAAVILRLTGRYSLESEQAFVSPTHDSPAGVTRVAICLAALGALALATMLLRQSGGFAPRRQGSDLLITECAIGLLVLFLALPVAHTHYLALVVFAIPLLAESWQRLSVVEQKLSIAAFLLLGPLGVLRILDPLVVRFVPTTSVNLYKMANFPFLGIVLAIAALARMHARQSETVNELLPSSA